jgi:hypothetical protein
LDNSRSHLTVYAIFVLILVVLSGLVYANYRFVVQNPGGNDFLARWMGANYWLVKGISPYDPSVSLATQQAIYGHPADPAKGEDKNHFVYPLNSMLFFGPFGLLGYTLARTLWMTVLELSLIGLAILSLRMFEWKTKPFEMAVYVLFSLTWYHGMRTIIIGQFSALNSLIILLGIYLVLVKRDFGAGLLLSLATAKPQMVFLLLPFLIIWAISVRRWELVWGIITGSFVQLGLTLALLPDWPRQMIMQILDYPTYTSIGSPLSIIAGAAPGIYRQINLFLHAVFAIYLLVEWYLALKKDEHHFLWAVFLTLVITNLVAFRTATTNYVVLLPVLIYVFKIIQERWRIAGRIVTWFVLATLWLGLWAIFLVTVKGNIEQPIMYLPLPFICLAGLWWVRWWATQAPRLPLELYLKKFP